LGRFEGMASKEIAETDAIVVQVWAVSTSVGNLRRVARLVLRIRARAVSAERIGPAISLGLLSSLFSSGLFTLPAPLEGRQSGLPAQHPSPPNAGWLRPRCRRQSTPCFGELNAQICSLISGLKLSHFADVGQLCLHTLLSLVHMSACDWFIKLSDAQLATN
jgi:hypothetical protein